jgi:hypothetical protein
MFYHLLSSPEPTFDILINPLLERDEYNAISAELIDKGFGRYLKDSALNKWLHPDQW